MKENIIRPSTFYWALALSLSGIFISGFIVTQSIGDPVYYLLSASVIFFTFSLILNYNNKIKRLIDYQEVKS